MRMNLPSLENTIGHRFASPVLLERAVTHRSWAHENRSGDGGQKPFNNETLEFLGDSVLGLVISEELFSRYPSHTEGTLTLMKHKLVSTQSLAEVAAMLGLGEHIRLSKGEESTGGRQKRALLANTLEAVIGAVFLDAGYIVARSFVVRIFVEIFRKVSPDDLLDHKTLLQEKLQAIKLSAPVYTLLRTEGPPHERVFFIEAVWENGRAEGSGRSIKLAEMAAAAEVLKRFDANGVKPK